MAVPTLVGVATFCFLLLRMTPGDPAQLMAGPQATPEQVEVIRGQLGLDRPEPIQYVRFMTGLGRGDLGTSFVSGRSVLGEIAAAAPYTLVLALLSIVIATVIGCSMGIVAAVRRNTRTDMVLSAVALFGTSTPVYWLALMAIGLFSVRLGWLPVAGSDELRSYVLPTLMLTVFNLGFIMRQARSALVHELGEEFVRTARAKGCPRWRVIFLHAFRNALLPILTIVGLQFGQLLGGAVIIESIFAWPGMGLLLINAIQARDFAVVQGAVLLFAVALIALNLITDVLYAYIDPRLRIG